MERFQVGLETDQLKRLDGICAAQGWNRSQFFRYLLGDDERLHQMAAEALKRARNEK